MRDEKDSVNLRNRHTPCHNVLHSGHEARDDQLILLSCGGVGLKYKTSGIRLQHADQPEWGSYLPSAFS